MSFIEPLVIVSEFKNWEAGFKLLGYVYGFTREYTELDFSKMILDNLDDKIQLIDTQRNMQNWTIYGSVNPDRAVIKFRFTNEQDAVYAALVL